MLPARFICCGVFAVAAVCGAGCSSDSAGPATAPSEPTASVPASFDDEGTWTREELTTKDQSLLQAYFQTTPSLAENSVISGDPHVYRSTKGMTRFYWTKDVDGQVQWVRLDAASGRISDLYEGNGFPFTGPTAE